MTRTLPWLALPLLFFAPILKSQQPDLAAPGPADTEVRLLDGSVIRTVVLQDSITIVTRYGTLTVPISDIHSIDVGLHIPTDVEETIARAIDGLGSDNYKARELAVKQLVDLGVYAYPQVLKALRSDHAEAAQRASLALEKIKAKHAADNLRLRQDDIIVTRNFTIVGQVTPPSLKVRNAVFGEVELKLSQVRTVSWLGAAPQELQTYIDAAEFGSTVNHWMKTDYEAAVGARVIITATGTINLWPQQGGVNQGGAILLQGAGAAGAGGPPPIPAQFLQGPYACVPAGYNTNGLSPPGTQFKAGALLGRVGVSGPTFLIGERFEGELTRDGYLYLHIVPSPWNNSSIGYYNVKIRPKTGLERE